jgi:Coenzyme PQQ synthesis protein D (PqqD)
MSSKGPLRKEGVLSRQLGEEWILYDQENSVVHIINATAEHVWDLCDGNHDRDEIAKCLQDAYLVSAGTALGSDVDTIIQEFSAHGLLRNEGT